MLWIEGEMQQVEWWFLEWSIDWIYWWSQDLWQHVNRFTNLKTTGRKSELIWIFTSVQGCACDRLHLGPLPDSHRVRRLHLPTLGHPKFHWAQHLPRTYRLHPLRCHQQTQQRSLHYWWDECSIHLNGIENGGQVVVKVSLNVNVSAVFVASTL